jgi:hypothetical protein
MKCTWRQCFNNALFSVHFLADGKYLNRACGHHLAVTCLAVDGPVSLKRIDPDPLRGMMRAMPKRLRRHQRRRAMWSAP